MLLDYTFGGEKIRKEVTGIGGETRLYLGGAEFVNGVPECYNHPEGRVLLVAGARRFQYKIADHLGDMCVFFEDVDENGIIKTEAAGHAESEVFQRHFYYPFGMGMEGGWAALAVSENKYQYNGKELEKGAGLGWYAYGFRYYDPVIGRFPGVDPIADRFAWVTTYNYAENKPINGVDLHGLQWGGMVDYTAEGYRYNPPSKPTGRGLDGMAADANTTAQGLIRAAEYTTSEKLNWLQRTKLYTWSYINEFGALSDQNDAAVLLTGENMDGSEATGTDKAAASVGIVIPFVPGSLLKKVIGQVDGPKLGSFGGGYRNGHLAGKTHPVSGVPFDSDGFPDFSNNLFADGINDVMIVPTSNRTSDFAAANRAAGYSETPEGFTWHHHQDFGRMQLVEYEVHRQTGHTGGFSTW